MRADGIDANAQRSAVPPQVLRQRRHCALAGAISDMARSRIGAPDRGRIDDGTTASAFHMGNCGTAEEEHRIQIDVHRREPHFVCGFLDGSAGNDASIVEQDIDAAEAFDRAGDDCFAILLLPQIARQAVGLGAEFAGLIDHGLAAVGVDVRDHHAGTFGGEQPDQRLTDATGASGNHDNLVFEPHCLDTSGGVM
ncbi:hypothetical protein FQZ97_791070 [compost metagenome]